MVAVAAAQGAQGCDLCGLKIDGPAVTRRFDGQERKFCCQGCARVYAIAHDQKMLDAVLAPARRDGRRAVERLEGQRNESAYFSLKGMWCAGCAISAERVLRKQAGVVAADVSFSAERGRIQYDPQRVDPDRLLKELGRLGYDAQLLSDAGERPAEKRAERLLFQLITAAAFGMQVMVLYVVQLYPLYAAGGARTADMQRLEYLAWLLTTPVLFYGGLSFLQGAWRALRAGTASMDTLVALGTLSAYGYSAYASVTGRGETYFDSVGMITTFVMAGRYLEALAGARARKDLQHLLQLQPQTAHRRAGKAWEDVPASALRAGDTILVRPGERAPADAEIVDGQAGVDESLVTGESAPKNKGAGDALLAGTVVADGALVCRVTRGVGESRLAQIARLVEETLSTKLPVQRMADRASAYFTLGILSMAGVTFLGWQVSGRPLPAALLTAVAVLVVACPCALGLATPLALVAALGRSAQEGILVRNPAGIEAAPRIGRAVFDKTGTLTLGKMSVVATVVDAEAGIGERQLLRLAAAVEQNSEHPLARAIVAACKDPLPPATEFQALPGMGASARVAGSLERRVLVGSMRMLGVDGQSPLAALAQAHAERGEAVVWVGWADAAVAGFLALRDAPNPTAAEALRALRELGIESAILSGDSEPAARSVAAELGVTYVEGNLTPAEKAERIRAWQGAGMKVAMVGDGVNDAPALAQADLSITVAGGTDVAGETSDVLLTRHDLGLIPAFFRRARRTRRTVVGNLGWAFAYNLVAVPLASAGMISPAIAAVAMAASSLLVVGNSLRLRA